MIILFIIGILRDSIIPHGSPQIMHAFPIEKWSGDSDFMDP
jgi:hypothetical protein